jgi:cell fate (sporulation/competence/biofilm development) regulator YlbF (YheA/YmcA/DUF963 family)
MSGATTAPAREQEFSVDAIQEKARDIGRLLSQTDEYRALKQANERLAEDRDAVTLLNRLSALEEELSNSLRSGREPSQEQEQEYESIAEELQQKSTYQALVAAQSNFDRFMVRINEEIGQGIKAGENSRIILPS